MASDEDINQPSKEETGAHRTTNYLPEAGGDAFDTALARFRESWFLGEQPDLQAFCKRYPECGTELRKEIDDFLFVARNLPHSGVRREEIDLYPDPPNQRTPGRHLVASAEIEEIDIDKVDSGDDQIPAGTILGDFRVVREIGRGGMGIVYEAVQISMKRKVALKVLLPHLSISDKAVNKFRREAEAGGRQSHSGIVVFYAIGKHKNVHYIAQELIGDGFSLAHKIEKLRGEANRSDDDFIALAGFFLETADALHHAHCANVTHRDIKPSNIMVTADGRPKVADFGLAKIEDGFEHSRSGELSGTPYYMSPEQAMAKRIGIDYRTDIFSLGVTFYEALTLERPFQGTNREDILKRIMFYYPPEPHRIDPKVPRDMSVICAKAMEKDVNERFQSMDEFAAELRRFLTGQNIETPASTALARVVKRVRWRPGWNAAIGLIAAVVILVILMLQSHEPTEAEKPIGGNQAETSSIFVPEIQKEPLRANLNVLVYPGNGHSTSKELGEEAFSARFNDNIRLLVELSGPSYCYLIAFNPDGKEQLCFPRDGSIVPERIDRLAHPEGLGDGFGLTDGIGLQAFVLLVSREPLPAYCDWRRRAGAMKWKETSGRGNPVIWRYDGTNIFSSVNTRGEIRPLNLPTPQEFVDICECLRNQQPEFETIQAVAFQVLGESHSNDNEQSVVEGRATKNRVTDGRAIDGRAAVDPATGNLPGFPSTETHPINRALLIGINRYQSEVIPNLQGTHNDVGMIRQILTSKFAFKSRNIVTLTDDAATRKGILSALERLLSATGPRDRVFIHYSGHGSQVQDINGDEADQDDDGLDETLIPHDGRTVDIPDITDDELSEILDRFETDKIVIVIDACHSGTATRSLTPLTRSIVADKRVRLYEKGEKLSSRILPLQERFVVLTAARAHEEAMDGPVDGRYMGFFTYALGTTLDSAPPDATPREIEKTVDRILRRVQDWFLLESMPEHQFELPRDKLDRPLLASLEKAGKQPTVDQHPSRRAWTELQPVAGGGFVLSQGYHLGGTCGSLWAIYPPDETEFAPGAALAIARVITEHPPDARVKLIGEKTVFEPGCRAVRIAPSSATDKVPIRFIGVPEALQAELINAIEERFGAVEVVEHDLFARLLIEVEGKVCSVFGAAGLNEVDVFSLDDEEVVAQKLGRRIARCRDTAAIMSLENPNSRMLLMVRPAISPDFSTVSTGERGIRIVPALKPTTYRIKRKGEPPSLENYLLLEVEADRDCYLTIANVDREGCVDLLFPNSKQEEQGFLPQGKIPGGELIRIPDSLEGERANFRWEFKPPAGVDTVRVFACTSLERADDIRRCIGELNSRGNALASGDSRSVDRFDQLRDELMTRGIAGDPSVTKSSGVSPEADDWTAVTLHLRVTE